MKRLLAIIFWSVMLFVIYLAYLAIDIIYFGINSKTVKSDCIIVLGCQVYGTSPSPFLKARLDEALRLYNEGYGKYIIVSGGQGSGENITEALAMKNYLVSCGVDSGRIIMEDKSSSTMENVRLSADKMRENNLDTAVIVSNKYHLRRAGLLAKQYNVDASYSGVFLSAHKFHEIKGFIREIPATLAYLIFNYTG